MPRCGLVWGNKLRTVPCRGKGPGENEGGQEAPKARRRNKKPARRCPLRENVFPFSEKEAI
nr:MAG TPA: hypothetical protein [Caudoviricetes sp.]